MEIKANKIWNVSKTIVRIWEINENLAKSIKFKRVYKMYNIILYRSKSSYFGTLKKISIIS